MRSSSPRGRWPAGVLLAVALTWPAAAAGAGEAGDDEVEVAGDPLAPLRAVAEHCEPALVIATPDGVDGPAGAVALTSQALELDVPGWVHVSWQAADGTELTAVTVRTSTGLGRVAGDLAAGTAEDVQEIVFCGSAPPTAERGRAEEDDGDAEVLGVSYTTSEDTALAADAARRARPWATAGVLTALAGTALLLRHRRRPAGPEGSR